SRISATIRTARSRNSGGYLFELTDFILSQETKPPDMPGGFSLKIGVARRTSSRLQVHGRRGWRVVELNGERCWWLLRRGDAFVIEQAISRDGEARACRWLQRALSLPRTATPRLPAWMQLRCLTLSAGSKNSPVDTFWNSTRQNPAKVDTRRTWRMQVDRAAVEAKGLGRRN
ncbi:hypothetical protein, partial [Nocardia cyriacigeorgica]|uniref:hypothetical protein n=1 Tax=Nocardia cyriacigeorgica TaxID=135487 RepID=UPI001C49BC64